METLGAFVGAGIGGRRLEALDLRMRMVWGYLKTDTKEVVSKESSNTESHITPITEKGKGEVESDRGNMSEEAEWDDNTPIRPNN